MRTFRSDRHRDSVRRTDRRRTKKPKQAIHMRASIRGCGSGGEFVRFDVMAPGLVSIVLDCRRAAPLAHFWAVALGWKVREYDADEVARLGRLGLTPATDPTVAVDAPDGSLTLFVVEVPESKTAKNRLHLDVAVRDAAHYEELLELGARVQAVLPGWNVLVDPEGNEFCVTNPPRPSF
jgi:hypothetical protein